MDVQLLCNKSRYTLGEPVTGEVAWVLKKAPRDFTLQLRWKTMGKGDSDDCVVQELLFTAESRQGAHDFSFAGVFEPCSFSGTLISIVWEVVLVMPVFQKNRLVELVIGPGGSEIVCLPDESER